VVYSDKLETYFGVNQHPFESDILCMKNTTNNNNLRSEEIKSLFFYEFPEASKKEIYKNNNRKTGIYL
jgi:hypothetical protein